MTIEGRIISQAGVFQRSGQNVSKIECPTGAQRTFSLEGRTIILTDKARKTVRIITKDADLRHAGLYFTKADAIGIHLLDGAAGSREMITEVTMPENNSAQVSFKGRQAEIVAEFTHKE